MKVVLDLMMFKVLWNNYKHEYYVIGKLFDSCEHTCTSMSEAVSMCQAYDGAMQSYMAVEAE